jgi:hypothetical protein
MRLTWNAGLAEGTPSWMGHALLVGEGRGRLLVRRWLAQNPDPQPTDPEILEPADMAWADEWEAKAFAGELGLDEYVARQVLADPEGLRLAFYGPASIKTNVGGIPVELELETAYPESLTVELRVYPQTPVAFCLFLRIPGWVVGTLVTGDGASGGEMTDQDGWLALRRTWNRGDSLTIAFEVGDQGPPRRNLPSEVPVS